MIENNEQLAATLDYIAKWADILEGMRACEADKDNSVFLVTAAGPLGEIRKNLDLARAFAHRDTFTTSTIGTESKPKQSDFATARIPKVPAEV